MIERGEAVPTTTRQIADEALAERGLDPSNPDVRALMDPFVAVMERAIDVQAPPAAEHATFTIRRPAGTQ